MILPGGNEPVVLGSPVETGTVAWASPAGGSGFLTGNNGLQDSGDLISPVSLFYTTNNAVALSSTDVGLFDSYDHFYSYFSDTPFAGPLTPATLPSNNGNANNGGQFDDQKGDTPGPVIAAEAAPAPAAAGTEIVVGVGRNVSSERSDAVRMPELRRDRLRRRGRNHRSVGDAQHRRTATERLRAADLLG